MLFSFFFCTSKIYKLKPKFTDRKKTKGQTIPARIMRRRFLFLFFSSFFLRRNCNRSKTSTSDQRIDMQCPYRISVPSAKNFCRNPRVSLNTRARTVFIRKFNLMSLLATWRSWNCTSARFTTTFEANDEVRCTKGPRARGWTSKRKLIRTSSICRRSRCEWSSSAKKKKLTRIEEIIGEDFLNAWNQPRDDLGRGGKPHNRECESELRVIKEGI